MKRLTMVLLLAWIGSGCQSPNSALVTAAERGDLGALRAALARGADVDARPGVGLVDRGTTTGMTALMFAARSGDIAILEELLAAGADPDQTTITGVTALHVAVYEGQVEAARKLVEAGADASLRDESGHDALSYAVERGEREIAMLLLAAGTVPTPRVDRLLADTESYRWSRARGSGDPAILEQFVRDFPQSSNAGPAREEAPRLRKAADDQAFAAAREAGTSGALERYLHDFPEGRHRERAQDRMEQVAVARAAEELRTGSIDAADAAIIDFIRRYPDSPRKTEMGKKLRHHTYLGLVVARVIPWSDLEEWRSPYSNADYPYGILASALPGNVTIQGEYLTIGSHLLFREGTTLLVPPVWTEMLGMRCRGAMMRVQTEGIEIQIGSDLILPK